MIRTATLSDLDTLVRFNQAVAEESEDLKLDPERAREGVRAILEGRQAGRYLLLEEEGAPVGQLMLTYEWSDWRAKMLWWIQSVYVLPERRRRGHYRHLYEEVMRMAQAEGVHAVRLYADQHNTRAHAVYEALGMSQEHYRMYEALVR